MADLRSLVTYRIPLFLLLTVLLISLEMFVTHTSAFSLYPTGLSIAVLFDLVFVTTVLFYWLVARPLRLSNSRSVLVALPMLRIALFILPETAFPSDKSWLTLLIFAEAAVMVITVLRMRTVADTYRRLRAETDIETALKTSLAVVVSKRVAGAIMGEVLTLYYVLLGWRLPSDLPTEAHPVTTYRQSGQVALTVGLLMVCLVEGVILHVLLSRWNPAVAFWITALSGYGMLFFVADIIATVKRPSYLTKKCLHVRLGIRWRAQIPCSSITEVSLIHEKLPKRSDRLNGAFLTSPNVVLTFREPICIEGPYGIQRTVRQLSCFIDNRVDFVQMMSEQKTN